MNFTNIEEAINYRNQLEDEANRRLTPEEKRWLVTNPAYSEKFGAPFLVMDIITLKENTEYVVKVKWIEQKSMLDITPVFSVPLNNGYIKCDYEVVDYKGMPKRDKPIKRLCTHNCNDFQCCEFVYKSKLGCMVVAYDCETYDHRGVRYWGSSTGLLPLAMKRMDISDNQVMYGCTDMEVDEFDRYVFTVEWNERQRIRKRKIAEPRDARD